MLFPILIFSAAVFLNGATDAANAVTGPVAAGVLRLPRAALLAAAMNLCGMLLFSVLSPGVYATVSELADFPPQQGGMAVTAAMLAVVLWAGAAWRFGIPTSESHGLIAGLAGAALALGAPMPDLWAWGRVGLGLICSVLGGLVCGRLASRFLLPLQKRRFWRDGTVLGCAATALLHGAQDGQKFLGLAVAAGVLSRGSIAVFCCGALMLCGTLFGGRRTVEKLGRDMADADAYVAACADLGSAVALTAMTVAGLPVSTTHVKTVALSAAARGCGRRTDSGVLLQLLFAWVTTFPACGLLSYGITKVILLL